MILILGNQQNHLENQHVTLEEAVKLVRLLNEAGYWSVVDRRNMNHPIIALAACN